MPKYTSKSSQLLKGERKNIFSNKRRKDIKYWWEKDYVPPILEDITLEEILKQHKYTRWSSELQSDLLIIWTEHFFKSEIQGKISYPSNPIEKVVSEIMEDKKKRKIIMNGMKERFQNLKSFFLKKEYPLEIYRSIIRMNINKVRFKKGIGEDWTWDKNLADSPLADEPIRNEFIITALVEKDNINWIETFVRNMEANDNPFIEGNLKEIREEDHNLEKEIYLKKDAKVKVLKIEQRFRRKGWKYEDEEIEGYNFSEGIEGKIAWR